MKNLLIQFAIFLCFTPQAMALERFDIITTKELQSMLQQRKEGTTDFLLVNTLDTIIADHHSIPGSVNIPWSDVSKRADEFGENKEKLIITYCMGYR